MFADAPPDPVIAPDPEPSAPGRALASMIGGALVMLPLYSIAICCLVGGNWRCASCLGFGAASMLAGLGILFAIGRRAGECGSRGGLDTCLPR
jgi:hypothetical protein